MLAEKIYNYTNLAITAVTTIFAFIKYFQAKKSSKSAKETAKENEKLRKVNTLAKIIQQIPELVSKAAKFLSIFEISISILRVFSRLFMQNMQPFVYINSLFDGNCSCYFQPSFLHSSAMVVHTISSHHQCALGVLTRRQLSLTPAEANISSTVL